MKFTNVNADRVLRALVEGPMGAEIEAQAEAERAEKCTRLRHEFEAGQEKYLSELRKFEANLAALDTKAKDLKRQLDPIEQEWQKQSWLTADKRGAMTEHRDRYWRQLTEIADPRIAIARADFEARMRGCAQMSRSWETGPPPSRFNPAPTANNLVEVDRAAHYCLDAVDATHRWAKSGLQGAEVTQVYEEVLKKFPRIPMGKDGPGVIPEPVAAAPTDWSTLRQP